MGGDILCPAEQRSDRWPLGALWSKGGTDWRWRERDKQIWVMGSEIEVGAFVPSIGHGPERTFEPFWALASGGRDRAFGMDRVSSMVGLGDPFPPGIHSTGWISFSYQM